MRSTLINCSTRARASASDRASPDIKHKIKHSSECNKRDISLSCYIFTRLWPVKILCHSDSCNYYSSDRCV